MYFGRLLSREAVSDSVSAVAAQAEVFKDYQRLRAAHIGAMTGIADVRSWDLALPTPGLQLPVFRLEQTRVAALRALAPLGTDYVSRFGQLLDAKNQRMDLSTDPGHRDDDGFSISAAGIPSGLFIGHYSDNLAGGRVVAHEGGHAIHAQLMSDHGVSPFYRDGPNWLGETIAIVNEMLFYDDLYRHASGAPLKAYYLQALIDDVTFQIYTSAEETELEQSIYDGTMSGDIRNATDLDALTLRVSKKYDIWPEMQPSLAHLWITKRLMYQDPLYLVNYLYAGLLATKIVDSLHHDNGGVRQRYLALLQSGFDAPPEQLLRRLFGKEVTPRELIDADRRVIVENVDALRALYKQIEAKR